MNQKLNLSTFERMKLNNDIQKLLENIADNIQPVSKGKLKIYDYVPDDKICYLSHGLAYSHILGMDCAHESYIVEEVTKNNFFNNLITRQNIIMNVKKEIYTDGRDNEVKVNLIETHNVPIVINSLNAFAKEYNANLRLDLDWIIFFVVFPVFSSLFFYCFFFYYF